MEVCTLSSFKIHTFVRFHESGMRKLRAHKTYQDKIIFGVIDFCRLVEAFIS